MKDGFIVITDLSGDEIVFNTSQIVGVHVPSLTSKAPAGAVISATIQAKVSFEEARRVRDLLAPKGLA